MEDNKKPPLPKLVAEVFCVRRLLAHGNRACGIERGVDLGNIPHHHPALAFGQLPARSHVEQRLSRVNEQFQRVAVVGVGLAARALARRWTLTQWKTTKNLRYLNR